ncbi:MAG: biotin transporter BioY [Bacteroides sp.]|nr:biotin transporter BioY [Prevotella sp.]MCM1408100.1 biotin transporter BioY [Treponema brennaborense]MCM1469076.1 biotin transporter BioY [Bacteroides sp.]
MEQTENKSKKKTSAGVFTALFAAFICAGCFIQIPLPGGVPIVIQDMMAMLAGLLAGPVYGTAAVFLFLILGCMGLPVFSGKAGLHILTQGPTGGFLAGYLFAALTGGLILHFALPRRNSAHETKNGGSGSKANDAVKSNAYQWVVILAAGTAATAVLFICGTLGFMRITDSGLKKTLAATLFPFIPGICIKLAVMTAVTKKFRTITGSYIE